MKTATSKTPTFSKVFCAALFTVAAGISAVAHAGDYSETLVTTTAEGLRTTSVAYSDLDLSAPDAQKVLKRRLSRAAQKVCGSPSRDDNAGSLAQAFENRQCADNAIATAMRDIAESDVVTVASR
jgi:UrcA family protein